MCTMRGGVPESHQSDFRTGVLCGKPYPGHRKGGAPSFAAFLQPRAQVAFDRWGQDALTIGGPFSATEQKIITHTTLGLKATFVSLWNKTTSEFTFSKADKYRRTSQRPQRFPRLSTACRPRRVPQHRFGGVLFDLSAAQHALVSSTRSCRRSPVFLRPSRSLVHR